MMEDIYTKRRGVNHASKGESDFPANVSSPHSSSLLTNEYDLFVLSTHPLYPENRPHYAILCFIACRLKCESKRSQTLRTFL